MLTLYALMYAFKCLESEPSSNNPDGILSRATEIITANSSFCRQSSGLLPLKWTHEVIPNRFKKQSSHQI